METKDLIIYNGIFAAAEHVFNNTKCPAGEYTAKELSKNMLYKYFYKDSFFNNEIDNIFSVEFDGYKCTFPAGSAFNICAEIETAWGIPSARRKKFIRKADAAPVAVAFDVPAVSKSIINAVAPAKSAAADSCKYICVDAARRAVVATNGHVLTAAAVPDMFINLDEELTALLDPNKTRRFCLDATLFKTGKGNIKIRGNETAANGTNSKQLFNCYPFPSWEKVLPAVSEDAALILGKDFNALKKAILAAAKFSNTVNNVVILRAAKVAPEIEIIAYKENAKDPKTADQEKVTKIKLSQPVPFSFIIAINGKDLDAVAAADKMYLISEKQPVIFTAANYFALLMPVQIDKTPYHDNFFNSPAANVEILDICKFPALDAPNSAAAVASVQDEETAAPAADSWENSLPRATVLFNDINLFAEDQRARLDEIRNAAPAAEDAPAVAVQDEEETAAPVAVAAEDETRPAFEDAAAAFADEMPEYFNNLNLDEEEKARAAFAAAFADEETARAAAELETAPAVQDEEEETAPAVSLPVPVSAVNNWYAVYHFGKLENVYFSKLLADEIVINSLFVAGETKDLLAVPSPSAAPAEFPRQTCPLFAAVAAVQDKETAPAVQDEETAAPADSVPAADPVPAFASVFAIMPEIWETAAPAAEDETNGAPAADSVPFLDEETNGAPFAAEDAPAVAAFYLAANFARRARRVFSFAAALLSLLLITAAPRFITSVAVQETAPAVQDAQPAPAFILDEETAAPADSVPAAELRNSPETAPAVAADSLPADRMKQPRNARKRARRVNPDNLAPAVAVAADSVPFVAAADSVPFLETAAPADSVPAVASVAADSMQTAQPAPVAVQDAAPAAEDETAAPAAEDEETAPAVPADSVPAEDAPAPANSPAPAVPVSSVAVPGCPGVPAALLLILML